MTFHSKIDKFYIIVLLAFLFIMVFIIGALALLPFLSGDGLIGILISIIILLIVIGFTLWVSFSIKYVFNKKHLLVKGGPIKSRIPYENITKISPTTDIFTGYRILSSRNALEVFYENATLWGSIKISPENKKGFVDELKKRCPNLQTKQ